MKKFFAMLTVCVCVSALGVFNSAQPVVVEGNAYCAVQPFAVLPLQPYTEPPQE